MAGKMSATSTGQERTKRKRRSGTMQARGVARREQITSAAKKLLLKKNIEDISYHEIAEEAGVPPGSAYHFYPNVSAVYAAIAKEFLELYVETFSVPNPKAFATWQDVIDDQIERGAQLFRDNIAAMKIIIGGKTPPEIKHWDRQNDQRLAHVIEQDLSRHFQLPIIPASSKVFFYYVEIVDLFFSLSVLENETITQEMVKEAQLAGRAYLSNYIPAVLKRTI